ncbi:hypothetical protein BHAOGJBA_4424 [Methylobacterium hispanicum]|uniref:Periplasmic protein n=1 Tax=Methylobacterium hispanicum TaxID=270350 RepID=A0AAV4ZSC5_9HYPH|nr:hypothetical protein [Methylobacterium hispanicum]GJD90880.1 hypothetical protein BHAOGJBA_4424 [Methylobacterium hispanicum]
MRPSPIAVIGLLAILLSVPAAAEALSFETASYPSCGGCTVVFAAGDIDIDAGDRLLAEARRRGLGRGTVLVLDSPGGRLLGGLNLGRAIRQLGFDTRVGRLDAEGRPADGICASACALAFLGGVRRDVSPGSKFGVHRFYFPGGTRSYDPDEIGALQELTGNLVAYASGMGVDARLVSVSSARSDLRLLSADELRSFRVVWNPMAFSPWEVRTFRGGLAAVSHSADGRADLSLFCDETGTRRAVLVHRFDPPLGADEQTRYRRWFRSAGAIELLGRQVPVRGADFASSGDELYLALRLPAGFRPRPGAVPRLAEASGNIDYTVGAGNLEPALDAAFRNCVAR